MIGILKKLCILTGLAFFSLTSAAQVIFSLPASSIRSVQFVELIDHFPTSIFPSEHGCARTMSRRICRPDNRIASTFKIENVSLIGWGTNIESAVLQNGCLNLSVRLSVDHKGTGGMVCIEPVAKISFDLIFDY